MVHLEHHSPLNSLRSLPWTNSICLGFPPSLPQGQNTPNGKQSALSKPTAPSQVVKTDRQVDEEAASHPDGIGGFLNDKVKHCSYTEGEPGRPTLLMITILHWVWTYIWPQDSLHILSQSTCIVGQLLTGQHFDSGQARFGMHMREA